MDQKSAGPDSAKAGIGGGARLVGETPRAWLDVMGERVRQATVEGCTAEHDDRYCDNELVRAANNYIGAVVFRQNGCDPVVQGPVGVGGVFTGWWEWPWPRHWWKPTDRRRDLVKAGALILAEIERLDRAEALAACRKAPTNG
jgi:hypothetical protein